MKKNERWVSGFLRFSILVLVLVGTAGLSSAAQIDLTWNDNSANENGFNIERRIGPSGTYQSLANVAANIVSYIDAGLSDGTTYCYRVRGFNSTGYSGYSNEACTTTPTPAPVTFVLTLSGTGSGGGTVISAPVGINCSPDCSEIYLNGTVVTLVATAASNSVFGGWSGDADCTDGVVTVNRNINCMAIFEIVPQTPPGNPPHTPPGKKKKARDAVTVATMIQPDQIGVYRPSTGDWFLDRSGNGAWEGCRVDLCIRLFNGSGALPVVGDWDGSGISKLGLFSAESSAWFLDANGNGAWDGCNVDICSNAFGGVFDLPVVGKWQKGGGDRIAIFRRGEDKWYLDMNGNEMFDSCKVDKCPMLKIYQPGDVPVSGDWTGLGTTQIGFFRPSTGQWFLDRSNNRSWNGCKKDTCIAAFGAPGDIPVTGDWNGTLVSNIGVFRPSTGEWFLDLNGNGQWDGPAIDRYIAGYGQPGDTPVVGKW